MLKRLSLCATHDRERLRVQGLGFRVEERARLELLLVVLVEGAVAQHDRFFIRDHHHVLFEEGFRSRVSDPESDY